MVEVFISVLAGTLIAVGTFVWGLAKAFRMARRSS